MDNGVSILGFGLLLIALCSVGLPSTRSPEPLPKALETSPPSLPRLLSETGLYLPGTRRVDPHNLGFVPQYPLWSDGARKQRWIRLPEQQAIDAKHPDAFEFPVGTKFWKEFSFGRAVETRFMERLPDGSWRFASYVWDNDGREARLAPETGVRAVAPVAGGVVHDVPSLGDCKACHEGRHNPVLGFTALQLSPARDALAPHREDVPEASLNLHEFVARGALVNLPAQLLETPPAITGGSARENALRGYLYANCSSCHNGQGPLAELGLDFDVSVLPGAQNSLRASALGKISRFQPPGRAHALRIDPSDPLASVVLFRMQSRNPTYQMPPLGTRVVDAEGVQLLTRFLTQDLSNRNNQVLSHTN